VARKQTSFVLFQDHSFSNDKEGKESDLMRGDEVFNDGERLIDSIDLYDE
jgi:hypothetical protein